MTNTPELPDGFSIGPMRAAEVLLLDDMAAADGHDLRRHVVQVRLKARRPSPSSLE